MFLLQLLAFSVAISGSHGDSSSAQTGAVAECETINLLHVVPYPDSSELSGWDRGLEVIPAGHLAIRHINSRGDLLSGKTLRIIDVASEACERNANDGYIGSFSELLNTTCIHGVIGLYCSAVTNMVAPLLNHSQYGYIHLASSTSPLFNEKEYPFLFRNIASSAVFNKAMLALMDLFKWTRVSVIFDSMAFYFRSTGNNFAKLISLTDKDLLSTIPILLRGTEISDSFTIINSIGSRIGYYSVTIEESAIILCEAFKRRHLWPSYVHVFLERTVDEILSVTVSCTREEMIMAMEGVFTLQNRLSTTNTLALVSGMTYQDYYKEYLKELHRFEAEIGMELRENEYANSLYDQVWAFALAMNQSLGSTFMANDTFENVYERTPEIRRVLSRRMRNISFYGATGLIRFGPAQEVQTLVDIFQINKGNQTLIGVFNSYNESVSSTKQLEDVPEDSFRTEPHLVPTSLAALVLVLQSALFTVIVLNTVMLVYLRKEPEIKSSSLYISLIILLGCYLLCISPVFYTAYTAFYITNTTVFTILCQPRVVVFRKWTQYCIHCFVFSLG